jgi:hypothetical protein
MKRARWLILSSVAVVVILAWWVGFRSGEVGAVAAPPLSLEGYMDEKLPEAPEEKVQLKVDNFACYVCHGDYESEEMVVVHGKEGTGCIDCHGLSFDHRDDEAHLTPPGKMYARDDVDKMCDDCHDTHDASARKVIERWQERCPERTDPKGLVCTDCHYQHRLDRRTVRWNKRTGELLSREGEPGATAAD